MDCKKIVKYLLFIPMLVGAMELLELVLPLQKVTDIVTYKRISESKGGTNYNIDFVNHNDQFTEVIYHKLQLQDEVELHVTYFTKEVRQVTDIKSKTKLDNDTIEVYFQSAIGLIMFVVSFLFFRKEYLSSFNFRMSIIILFISIASLIRIINVN